MAKLSSINKNKNRLKKIKAQAPKRARLKAIVMNRALPIDERLQAQMQLSAMPRNGAANRYRNRCEVTGRARSVYRKFKLSRIKLREFGSFGRIPGLIKSSW